MLTALLLSALGQFQPGCANGQCSTSVRVTVAVPAPAAYPAPVVLAAPAACPGVVVSYGAPAYLAQPSMRCSGVYRERRGLFGGFKQTFRSSCR